MTRVRRLLLGALLAVTALAVGGLPAVAATSPPAIVNLRVVGGSETWHTAPVFQLDWERGPAGPGVEVVGVGYRLYDWGGNPVGPRVVVTDRIDSLYGVEVPPAPGIYTIEVWLLDTDGDAGPRATATLRFDNMAPPAPELEAPVRWLLGTEPAALKIDTPPVPLPPSGIRGYAISPGYGVGSFEAKPTSEGLLSLGTFPEGANAVQVAAISGAGIRSEVATATIRVDATRPELSLRGVPSGWSSEPVRVIAQARDALSGMEPSGPTGPFTAIAVDGGAPTRAWGDQVSAWVTGSGVHEVELSARDAAGNVAGEEAQAPPPVSAVVHVDEDPPRIAFAPEQDPSEPERLEATVTDALSGPSPSRGSIALRPAEAKTPYTELPTEVVGNRLIARWDSDAFAPGKYEFLATGYDLAGNSGTGTARDRGARMVLVNPVKAQVSLEAGFLGGRGRQPAMRVRYGRVARFGGRLSHYGGAPVAGAEIAVIETFAAGAATRQRTTTVRTGPDGAFSLRLPPGPSRAVAATYAGSRALTRADGPSSQLTTTASVRLRASATKAVVGGKPVVFSGKVGTAGAGRAVRGLPVELQFRYPGAGWSEFRTVVTDSRGRFRYAYRFSDDDSRGVRFQFRAYAKGREGWPYGPSASRPVLITGR